MVKQECDENDNVGPAVKNATKTRPVAGPSRSYACAPGLQTSPPQDSRSVAAPSPSSAYAAPCQSPIPNRPTPSSSCRKPTSSSQSAEDATCKGKGAGKGTSQCKGSASDCSESDAFKHLCTCGLIGSRKEFCKCLNV